MTNILDNLFNKQMLVRRVSLVFVLALTALTYKWGMDFAMTSARSGVDVAAILAALLTPLTTLQGFIFKFYSEARTAISQLQDKSGG